MREFLQKNYNPQRAEKDKAYLYSNLKHYGIASSTKRAFVIKHKNYLKSVVKSAALKLCTELWNQPSFEERNCALSILQLHADSLDITDMPLIEKIMREAKGWALLDNSIIPLMPYILAKDKRTYAYLKKWIRDTDFWVRRSAILAQLLFFRTGKGGNYQLFFSFAEAQFNESWIDKAYKDSLQRSRARFFIRKAIGWTLRELSHKNPQLVVGFLNKNKQKMAGLSYREAARRLSKEYALKLNA